MSTAALGWWVEGLMVAHLRCSHAEAEAAAATLTARKARRDPVLGAATFATVLLATPQLPGGASWWSGEGSAARAQVLAGRVDQAERAVARALGPAGSLEQTWDEAHRTAEQLFAAADDPEG